MRDYDQELEEERKARQEVLSVFNRSRSDFADAAEYEQYADHIEDLGLYAHAHERDHANKYSTTIFLVMQFSGSCGNTTGKG